ncbi:hypothetical protein [Xanthobacter flavus]|uniref:hypothetical protein n=1 Tax=Xanthobacter flavus TaxID=281 RepID=UPI001AE2DDFF|nr:hypothetical protein [Xanthobacter flavus]MBP2147915.1 bacteriorhodopsin [Xanthobacter flavus]
MRRRRAAGEPQWFFRRLVAMGVIGFAAWRLMMLESAPDTRVNETIAWGWILLLATVVLGYLGFASAQDIAAIFATRSGTPYAPTPEPPDPPERSPEPPRNFAG